MSYQYPYCNDITLHVKGRISAEDARRQKKTARTILKRLEQQPGLVLADEVGMGKTFVALAAAVSVALKDSRPVVVMVPPTLKEKWPRDFELFKEKCLPPEIAKKLRYGRADRAVQFLKMLDDPPHRKKGIIFLTHGALTRGLADGWVKLALLHRALYRRKNSENIKRALCRRMNRFLHNMKWVEKQDPDIWWKLLHTDPTNWLGVLHKNGIDPENDNNPDNDDDPVPASVLKALQDINTDGLYEALTNIPLRDSKYADAKISVVRKEVNKEIRELWGSCITSLSIKLPLLILDEAHHLKNEQTRLASLFNNEEAVRDAEEIDRGPLGGVFERMLFLTATPFQLGHYELCSVLERFRGIAWRKKRSPEYGRVGFEKMITHLREGLDAAQRSAMLLDESWGRLRQEDIVLGGIPSESVEQWWNSIHGTDEITANARAVIQRFNQVDKKMRVAEKALQPWVIRHLRARKLPSPNQLIDRRKRLPGRSIISGNSHHDAEGIELKQDTLLPFLLAARAAVYAPNSRPVFAEGLASSYEAFLNTRRNMNEARDTDDDPQEVRDSLTTDSTGAWYLKKLDQIVVAHENGNSALHPKISATVKCAVEHWLKGEKVLIFCHYIATGRALRQHISHELRKEIISGAASRLGCDKATVTDELERIGNRFFDSDSPVRLASDEEVQRLLQKKAFAALTPWTDKLVELVRRFLRTPSFLLRYLDFQGGKVDREAVVRAFENTDASGQSLKKVLEDFFSFLVDRCGENERGKFIEAVNKIQPGSILGADVMKTFGIDELQGDRSERLLANVRLINGGTKQDSRERTMLAFNTPFFPEILIASSVMAEGVDLHLNCRHIIHHDLCWNPSTLEQRTGRVDRIGGKVERCGNPIHIYLPYVSETQDEKMFRVVTDRERWFNVVMGEQYKVDARSTEKLAERIPLPKEAAEALAFRLEV